MKAKDMTVREFQQAYSETKGKYIYSYEDQDDGKPAEFIRFQIEFDTMIVATNPDTIMFTANNGEIKMVIDCVRSVKVDDSEVLVGDVFTLFFGRDDDIQTARFLHM